jgi:hypothetical protein
MSGIRLGWVTWTESFVTGRKSPTRSSSWNASRPCCASAAPPAMATTGECATYAPAMPVTRFVAPGPLVTRHTAGAPVTRASPSAMKAPPCSWRTFTYVTLLSS